LSSAKVTPNTMPCDGRHGVGKLFTAPAETDARICANGASGARDHAPGVPHDPGVPHAPMHPLAERLVALGEAYAAA
jgi:hypothetical protein